jgi:hypothetical protein
VNGLVSVLKAGVTKTELAAAAARSAARRDSMSEFPPEFMQSDFYLALRLQGVTTFRYRIKFQSLLRNAVNWN